MGWFSKVVFILLLRVTQLWAFSSMAPLSTCEYMFPHHGNVQGQPGPSPYNITVSNSSYTPGDNLTVTILGSTTFQGLILQAQSNDSSIAWPFGEFIEIDLGTKNMYCSGGKPNSPKAAVSHHNPQRTNWTSRQFTWRAPSKSAGNIRFIATIVENYYRFWVKVASPVITGPPAESFTRGAPTESFQISKTGCGDTKGCYSLPPSCTGSADCDYLFTYQVSDGNVTMEMSANERYVSVAFNDKKLMDGMDSILCATMATNLAELRHYDSLGHLMIRKTLPGDADISLKKIVYEDGRIKCRVIRKLKSNAPVFKDLTKKWYILFAHGKTSSSGSGQYHYGNRSNTAEKVDLSVAATLVDEQSQVKDTITKEGCGKTKSCYSEPTSCKASSDCFYLVTIRPLKAGDGQSDSQEVEFEISAKSEWTSIGFDKDKKMPETDAIICADVNGRVSVDHYLADKRYGRPSKTTPKPSTLKQLFTESNGGVVSCRFRRMKKDPKMADLTESWYLVYTWGPMRGDSIGKHDSYPKLSPRTVDFYAVGDLSAEAKDSSKIKAHGSLMIIAWIGFASVGIFMARYMKAAFGDKEILGTKIWFTFHRSLMFLTVILTIASIVVIFVDAGRWTAEAGAHPYTGIIVLVLAAIQPIMALYRPHPGEKKRYIFNWAHRGVGLSSLILAVVSIFLGILLDGSGLDDSALYVMIVYCIGVVIVIMFDAFLVLKKSHRTSYIKAKGEEQGDHVVLEITGDQFVTSRKVMLGFLTIFVFGVVVALVVLIAVSGEVHDHHAH